MARVSRSHSALHFVQAEWAQPHAISISSDPAFLQNWATIFVAFWWNEKQGKWAHFDWVLAIVLLSGSEYRSFAIQLTCGNGRITSFRERILIDFNIAQVRDAPPDVLV
jgi:hypothetical protein